MKRFRILLTSVVGLFMTHVSFAQEAVETTEATEAKSMQDVAQEQLDVARQLIEKIIDFATEYSFQVLGGLIVLVLGWIVAGYVARLLMKVFAKKNVDITLSKFIAGTAKLLVIIFAVIVALGKFGIEIAPIIAGISVIGFGTSFALQGTLANYVAGFSLILTRPFRVGDIVEVADVMGEVTEIKLPRTEMKTVDGHMILIPNKHIVGEIIQNYSERKRLKIEIGISYDSDVEKALKIVRDVVSNDERIFKGESLRIGITEFADSSINLCARVKCLQDNYWDVMFDLNKKIFSEFNNAGIVIPFPQRDVHIIQEK